MALSLAIFPLASGLELLQPYLVKLAIDDYILARDWVGLGRIAALFTISLAGLYALRVAQAYVTQLTGQRVIHDLRGALWPAELHLTEAQVVELAAGPLGAAAAEHLRACASCAREVEDLKAWTRRPARIRPVVYAVAAAVVLAITIPILLRGRSPAATNPRVVSSRRLATPSARADAAMATRTLPISSWS